MAGVYQFGYTGKAPDGSTCCGSGPSDCGVVIAVTLTPLSSDGFCNNLPQTINYSITGTSNAGKSITVNGSVKPGAQSGTNNYGFGLTLTGTAVPDGSYSIHLYEYGTDPCTGAANVATGRFDVTQSFSAACPRPTVAITMPAQYDILSYGAAFTIAACYQGGEVDKTTCYGDDLTIQYSPVGSPCRTITGSDGSKSYVFKITSYPATIGITGSAQDCIPATDSTTYTGCRTGTSPANSGNRLVYRKLPIAAVDGYNQINPATHSTAVVGATITISGKINGSGTTNDGNGGCGVDSSGRPLKPFAYATISVDPSATDTVWTISAPGYVTVTYRDSEYTAARKANRDYGGGECPWGGRIYPKPDLGPGTDPNTNPNTNTNTTTAMTDGDRATPTMYASLPPGARPVLDAIEAPEPARAMPPLPRLAGNFARAVVRHAADGFAAASEDLQAARLAACRACPLFEPATERCSHEACGCWCTRKAAWLSESCPAGRWPA